MERLSRILTDLLLLLCALILGLALLLGTLGSLPHKSYLIALIPALAAAALLLRWRRQGRGASLWARLGAGRSAALLFALCLLLSLLSLLIPLEPAVDARTYWNSALALSRGEALPNPVFVALFPHILGYARFLSLVLRVFGASLNVAKCCSALIAALSGLLLFALLLRQRDLDSAAFGYLLWALCPSKTLYCAGIYADGYYTCLLLLFLLLVLLARRPGTLRAALLGALGGLALRLLNTARPIAAVPLIAAGIWILLLRGKELREKKAWLRWGAFLALALAVYLPLGHLWDAYAARCVGEDVPSVPGYSICVGFNEESGGSYSEEDMQRLLALRDELGSADAAQRQMLQEAMPRIRAAKLQHLLPHKLGTLLGNDEGGAFYAKSALSERAYSLLALGSNAWYYTVLLLALAGLWALRGESGPLLLVPLYLVGLTLAQMLVEVAGRYHYSLIPMLVILAACAARPKRGENV